MASEAAAAPAEASAKKEPDWMQSIAGQIRFLSTGDRAGLRRMDLTRSHAADGTVIKLLTRAKVPQQAQGTGFDRWRLVTHVAAILSGTGATQAHAEGRRLGSALREADYSENRLLRLLAVRGEALDDQVRRVARVLAQKGKHPINLWTLYHLVGSDAVKAEAARIRIAQDYYAAAARSEEGTSSDA
ncbi:type I-E CRISPR-associated protein Cse2/CasB [Sphingomonas carotinifaciens]|uniref:type I-E CRISPR-associated protein Cse2/CasB n=1 Tax=Sphingomonas carotinifaciens TaxID=1166323 RepID=UPI0039A0207E